MVTPDARLRREGVPCVRANKRESACAYVCVRVCMCVCVCVRVRVRVEAYDARLCCE